MPQTLAITQNESSSLMRFLVENLKKKHSMLRSRWGIPSPFLTAAENYAELFNADLKFVILGRLFISIEYN